MYKVEFQDNHQSPWYILRAHPEFLYTLEKYYYFTQADMFKGVNVRMIRAGDTFEVLFFREGTENNLLTQKLD